MPALFTRTSMAGTSAHERTVVAAAQAEANESLCSSTILILTLGLAASMSRAVSSALDGLRAARIRSDGWALVIARTNVAPTPFGETPVVRMTFPLICAA